MKPLTNGPLVSSAERNDWTCHKANPLAILRLTGQYRNNRGPSPSTIRNGILRANQNCFAS